MNIQADSSNILYTQLFRKCRYTVFEHIIMRVYDKFLGRICSICHIKCYSMFWFIITYVSRRHSGRFKNEFLTTTDHIRI